MEIYGSKCVVVEGEEIPIHLLREEDISGEKAVDVVRGDGVVGSEIPISPRERESPGSPGEQSLDKYPGSSWQGENVFVEQSPRGEPGNNSPDEEFYDIFVPVVSGSE